MLFFSEKARKECFSFYEKHKRDGFSVTFRLCEKYPKADRGLRPSGLRGTVQNPCGGILGEILKIQRIKFF